MKHHKIREMSSKSRVGRLENIIIEIYIDDVQLVIEINKDNTFLLYFLYSGRVNHNKEAVCQLFKKI